MKHFPLFIGLFLASVSVGRSQAQEKLDFSGLKRTNTEYIKRVIGFDKTTVRDSTVLNDMVAKIKNTRLFNEVSYSKNSDNRDTVITFHCEELRSTLPILEIGATADNQWFRLGLQDENGLGKGIKTIAFYQFNDKHSFYLKQKFPMVFKNVGFGYLLRKWSFLEPFNFNNKTEFYVYDSKNAEINFTFPFDINRHELEIGTGFMAESFTHTMPGMQMDGPEKFAQKRISIKTTHTLNHLNYNTFYVNGWSNTLNVLSTFALNEKHPFISVYNDFKYLKTFAFKGNLAFRNRLGIASNSNTFLAPFILDSYYNIRGVGNRVDRGTASIVVNTEYRQTVWENKTFGIQTIGFCDSGTWRKPGGTLADMSNSKNIQVFAGIGSRFIYKKAYDVILSFDYGWNIKGNGQGFVFGIGQYF